MHENKIYFFMFCRKPGILIPDLYFYNIKIQTNIDQNALKKYAGNHKFSENIFLNFFGLGRTRSSKEKQTGENSPLFTCNVNSGAARERKKKKKRSGGLPGGRPFLRELELPVLCCWTAVLFFLCSFFYPLLSPVSPFLFLFLMVVVSLLMVALVAADGGSSLRWRAVFAAVLPVCAEAQASSSSSRVCSRGRKMVRG